MFITRRKVQKWLDELSSDDESRQKSRQASRAQKPLNAPSRVDSIQSQADSAVSVTGGAVRLPSISRVLSEESLGARSVEETIQRDAIVLAKRKADSKDEDSGYDGSDIVSIAPQSLLVSACLPNSLNLRLAELLMAYMISVYQLRQCGRGGASRGGGSSARHRRAVAGPSSTGNQFNNDRKGKRKADEDDRPVAIKREKKVAPCTKGCSPGGYFGCPFAKANHNRYRDVHGQCTHPRGFATLAELKDHLKRFHSLRSYCWSCRKRFGNGSLGVSNRPLVAHLTAGNCTPRPPANDEPEWMTNEQEEQVLKVDWHALEGDDPREKWTTIFTRLFPWLSPPCPCYNFYVINPELDSTPEPTVQDEPEDEVDPVMEDVEETDLNPLDSFNPYDNPEPWSFCRAEPSAADPVSSRFVTFNNETLPHGQTTAVIDSAYGTSSDQEAKHHKLRDDSPIKAENIDSHLFAKNLAQVVTGSMSNEKDLEMSVKGAEADDDLSSPLPPFLNVVEEPMHTSQDLDGHYFTWPTPEDDVV